MKTPNEAEGCPSRSGLTGPVPPGSPVSDPDDSRVAAALEEYLTAAEAGRPLDRDEFLGRHPDLAPALAGCLADLDLLNSAGWRASGEPHGPPALVTPLEAARAT